MAMNIGSSDEGEEALNSSINTTPLVDVMLVLLIIFLITIPVITQSVKVDLPKAANIPTQTKPENINIAVDAQGNIFWNTAMIPTCCSAAPKSPCTWPNASKPAWSSTTRAWTRPVKSP